MTSRETLLDPERERVTRLLASDVEATLGSAHRAAVAEELPRALEFTESADQFAERLVDGVQQLFHDTFVDTTWPACPRHPNHPLWFHDGAWWCEADEAAIFVLGELPPRGRTD